jgi:hypothetical protein
MALFAIEIRAWKIKIQAVGHLKRVVGYVKILFRNRLPSIVSTTFSLPPPLLSCTQFSVDSKTECYTDTMAS